MRVLAIDRNRWARGGKNGPSNLLNTVGNMCCLGFELRSLGLQAGDIEEIRTPHAALEELVKLEGEGSRFKHLVEEDNNSSFTKLAMELNDDTDMGEAERERRLSLLFDMVGIQLEFHNGESEPPA